MTTYRVGYFIGSIARASINRTLSKALIRLAPAGLEFVEIPIKDLPLYSYDYDEDYPPEGRALKEAIARVDAVLFVTPEYNRSIPGGLKNAIDWASRPWGTNSLCVDGKARQGGGFLFARPGRSCGRCISRFLLPRLHGFRSLGRATGPRCFIRSARNVSSSPRSGPPCALPPPPEIPGPGAALGTRTPEAALVPL